MTFWSKCDSWIGSDEFGHSQLRIVIHGKTDSRRWALVLNYLTATISIFDTHIVVLGGFFKPAFLVLNLDFLNFGASVTHDLVQTNSATLNFEWKVTAKPANNVEFHCSIHEEQQCPFFDACIVVFGGFFKPGFFILNLDFLTFWSKCNSWIGSDEFGHSQLRIVIHGNQTLNIYLLFWII